MSSPRTGVAAVLSLLCVAVEKQRPLRRPRSVLPAAITVKAVDAGNKNEKANRMSTARNGVCLEEDIMIIILFSFWWQQQDGGTKEVHEREKMVGMKLESSTVEPSDANHTGDVVLHRRCLRVSFVLLLSQENLNFCFLLLFEKVSHQ